MRIPALLAFCLALSACVAPSYRDSATPIAAQRNFQPERYLGRWYEIARYPVIFEEGCTATTADYGPIDADTISVLNTCRKGAPDGPVERIAGTAEIVAPGELKVRFSGVPFVAADYWVLWVDADYRTAVVGVPSGRAGWILARTPTISPARRAEAEAVLSRNGYDPSRLYDVPQVAP
jgi:apolipoprotein D and lipocalin family protein